MADKQAVEIYDSKSEKFGNILLCGQEYAVVQAHQGYTSMHTYVGSPYDSARGCDRYIPIPAIKIELTLRRVPAPPPPPPAPKRTWATAMGLRKPGR
jgi:hypothetical protein